MKKSILFFFLLFQMAYLQAQPVDHLALLDLGDAQFEKGNYKAALVEYDKILQDWGAQEEALFKSGICYFKLDKLADARAMLSKAYKTENGAYDRPLQLAALDIVQYANMASAKKHLSVAAALLVGDDELQQAVSTLEEHRDFWDFPEDFNPLITFLKSEYQKFRPTRGSAEMARNVAAGLVALRDKDASTARAKFDAVEQAYSQFQPVLNENHIQTCHTLGQYMYNHWEPEHAQYFAEKGLAYFENYQSENYYLLSKLIGLLGDAYARTGNTSKAILLYNQYEMTIKKCVFRSAVAEFLSDRISYHIEQNQNEFSTQANQVIRDDVEELLNVCLRLEPGRRVFYNAVAEASYSVYFFKVGDNREAQKHAEEALVLARQTGFDPLIRDIESTLDVLSASSGQATGDDLAEKYQKRVQDALQEGRVVSAITELNNLGAFYFNEKNYAKAIPVLEQAIQVVEEYRGKIPVKSRLEFMHTQASVYKGLLYCLANQGEKDKLFTHLENSRSRATADLLGISQSQQRITPAIAQSLVSSDEALLLYGVTGLGKVAICVVTSQGIQVFNADRQAQFFSLLKKIAAVSNNSYEGFNPFDDGDNSSFSLIMRALREGMQDTKGNGPFTTFKPDLLAAFYQLLISPIQTAITGKKTLIICPDEHLSFLPFESLIAPNRQYLINNYGVRYVPSLKVLKYIQQRTYPASRSNVIAFGGATYAPYERHATRIKSDEDYFQLLDQVDKHFQHNQSQRSHYAALGIEGKSWTYLPGTLTEVKNIQQKISGVDAYFDSDFSETKIKALSKNGQLSGYRAIHLATHGLSIPTVPSLSCVVTTLTPSETNGEDGYLTTREVEQLKLKADFVALSACETGLGKIYEGEGVSGFSNAFLIAGANGLSVSQWAINDYATMLFMSGLYDLVFNQSYTFFDAMVQMKRKFVQGEFGDQFKNPNYWAPFAYYGI